MQVRAASGSVGWAEGLCYCRREVTYGVSLMEGERECGTSHCLVTIIWHLPYDGREFEKQQGSRTLPSTLLSVDGAA